MNVAVTILVDNYLTEPLVAEHGFAALITYGNKRVLFDTGQSGTLFHNAQKLNISLKNIDYLILSHGHFDHGGNIAAILKDNPQAIMVAHQNCTIPRYSIHSDKPIKAIGLDSKNKAALVNHPHQLWCTLPTEIIPGFWVSGEIPRVTDFEDTGGPFYLDSNKKLPDTINDDMCIWFESCGELHVICGCCHSGIVNTIMHIKKVTAKHRIKSLTGGLHLLHSNKNRLDKTMAYLSTTVEKIDPCHCSGKDIIALCANA